MIVILWPWFLFTILLQLIDQFVSWNLRDLKELLQSVHITQVSVCCKTISTMLFLESHRSAIKLQC